MFSTYEINPWPYFHIMFFNSVYRLPKKTVKIEEEPLLAVEGGRWCTTSRCMFLRKNFGQCGTSFQSHELILNMKKKSFTKRCSNFKLFYLFKYGLLVHS